MKRRQALGLLSVGSLVSLGGITIAVPQAVAEPPGTTMQFVATRSKKNLAPAGAARQRRSNFQESDVTHKVGFTVDDSGVIGKKSIATNHKPQDGRNAKAANYEAASDGIVQIEWFSPEDESITWQIYRNNNLIGSTSESTYIDDRSGQTGKTTYKILGSQEIEIDGKLYNKPYCTILEVPAIDSSPIGLNVDNPVATSFKSNFDLYPMQHPSMRALLGFDDFWMHWQINTFIPDDYIRGPFGINACLEAYNLDGVGWYGGDDRTFAAPSNITPSVRVGLEDWSAFDGSTGESKSTGVSWNGWTSGTRLYDANFNLIEAADVEPRDVITPVGGLGGPTGGGGDWLLDANDPLCGNSAPINYSMFVSMYGDGEYNFVGEHDQAPSYEMRLRTGPGMDTGDFKNVYEFENRGFEWLLAPAPNASVEVRGDAGGIDITEL